MANKRRGHGEGSIYQRKDGRWTAAITLAEGGRKSFYGKTRREVQEKLKVALREQQQGMLVTSPQQSLKQFLERWLEAYKPTVRLHTYTQARSVVYYHLVPALGHVALQKLTPEMIRGLYRQKLDEGKKPATVRIIHSMLHRALEEAVKDGLVARNVASLVKAPRVEKGEKQVLTAEQAKQLLEVARGSSLDALLVLALATGMRRGELLALRWDDIDLERGTLVIRHTMSRVGGYGLVVGEPKTRAGRRQIVLPVVVIEALRRHQAGLEQIMAAVGDGWQELGAVFAEKDGGFPDPDNVVRRYKKLLRQVGLPRLRFHDLRHSAATILLAAGVHPKKVQELLGHSSISITLDVYSHVLPSMQQEVADKMDDLLG